MGRKNSNVRRKNVRRDRREPGQPRPKRKLEIPRIPVESLIMPDGQCNFPNRRKTKAMFATESKARAALHQAIHQRKRTGSTHVEKRYYKCPEGGCGGYHLTSRDEYDDQAWKGRQRKDTPQHG